MSETTSEDLFRKPIEEGGKMGTFRQLDEETGGQISRIMPEFGNMVDVLRAEFGDDIGDYSGLVNTDTQREAALQDFDSGKRPMLYMSYASGGIGRQSARQDRRQANIGDLHRAPIFGVFAGSGTRKILAVRYKVECLRNHSRHGRRTGRANDGDKDCAAHGGSRGSSKWAP